MKKKELLERYKLGSLSEIKDEQLIQLAKDGLLGEYTMESAMMVWAFDSEHDFAEHIRKALDEGKEVRTTYIWGEHLAPDRTIVEYIKS